MGFLRLLISNGIITDSKLDASGLECVLKGIFGFAAEVINYLDNDSPNFLEGKVPNSLMYCKVGDVESGLVHQYTICPIDEPYPIKILASEIASTFHCRVMICSNAGISSISLGPYESLLFQHDVTYLVDDEIWEETGDISIIKKLS